MVDLQPPLGLAARRVGLAARSSQKPIQLPAIVFLQYRLTGAVVVMEPLLADAAVRS